MRALTFRRTSDAPPREHEVLEIASDATFEMWRSLGRAVGRFAGAVPDADQLAEQIDRALDARPPLHKDLAMDASLERIEVGETTVALGARETPDGAWGALFERCRALLSDLTEQPLAALVLVVDDPALPRLEHRGTEELMIELIQPVAVATVWRDGVHVDTVRGAAGVIDTVEAGPGWDLDIPLPDMRGVDGDRVVIQVAVDVHHGDLILPVEVYGDAERAG
ncbi:MAG: hypothetical protein ACRDZZ_08840 [Ilumatobacteraceae bacterium]